MNDDRTEEVANKILRINITSSLVDPSNIISIIIISTYITIIILNIACKLLGKEAGKSDDNNESFNHFKRNSEDEPTLKVGSK